MVHLLLAIIYLSFVSLGLPDALLGSAWPIMCVDLNVPLSYAGAVSMIIAAGTIVSSLLSDRLTRWLGAAKVTAISAAMTAAALFGFSVSSSYWMLLLWAIPYGLGAGSVDAALNNYVAVHYASRHMSWLHCMWGLGAAIGPYILGGVLTGEQGWNMGYRYVSLIQIVVAAVLFLSVPMWQRRTSQAVNGTESGKALSLKQVLSISGAKEIMLAFFCYCGAEQTAILWGSSYLVAHNGISEELAAGLGSLFLIGITAGRGLSGFLTYKFNDTSMIRLGQGVMVLGIVMMLLPMGEIASMAGLILIGLGCAPVYPCIIHSTPDHFGAENSQALIGVQMASAYVGILALPPLFGLIAQWISISLLPWYLAAITVLMIIMCERLNKKCVHA